MISILVDEEACVGCTLCVETCPTEVFKFNDSKNLPEVAKAKECFGCLACSEICPSDAIEHKEVLLSEAYHHDPYALEIASKLAPGVADRFNTPQGKEKADGALSDLGIRLLSIASVFKQVLGDGLPAVGTLAGRTLASQLPRYQVPGSVNEALQLAKERFAGAWEIEPKLNGDDLKLEVKACVVRDLCKSEGIELGGELCTLYYNYLAGYLGKLAKIRPKLVNANRSWEKCIYEVKLY